MESWQIICIISSDKLATHTHTWTASLTQAGRERKKDYWRGDKQVIDGRIAASGLLVVAEVAVCTDCASQQKHWNWLATGRFRLDGHLDIEVLEQKEQKEQQPAPPPPPFVSMSELALRYQKGKERSPTQRKQQQQQQWHSQARQIYRLFAFA